MSSQNTKKNLKKIKKLKPRIFINKKLVLINNRIKKVYYSIREN